MDRTRSAASPPQRFYAPAAERHAIAGRGRDSRPRHGSAPPNARAAPQGFPSASDSHGSHGSASTGTDTGADAADFGGNVIVLTSPSGGIGLSVLAAMLAWELHSRELSGALVDADFRAGGLDVLLGLESEEGLRFGGLDAPLGRIEGEALSRRLPQWEGIGVLAFDPWDGDAPNWWEIQAAIRALAEANDVVVVDAADGGALDTVPGLSDSRQIVAIELSVLGVARAKAHMARFAARDGVAAGDGVSAGKSGGTSESGSALAVVGIRPRGVRGNAGCLSVQEASDYLSYEVVGPLRFDRKLQRDLLEGLGIRRIGAGSASCVRQVADQIEAWMKEER
ncbi:MAG: hypothetical protein ABF532_11085 [Bifidobacterium sp.]|uniref:hypothetical protein n=1 Tax=Bifidobacterium sp. TaxID=41200 RepID=UPI0039E87A80